MAHDVAIGDFKIDFSMCMDGPLLELYVMVISSMF